jgi:prepilin-type N-terminal cleavage/methylation domain-containing protein
MRCNSTRAGFTLIEVLVVLVIASIVMAVLVSVLGSSFEILRTGETRAQLNSNARVLLNYECDDIASASYIPLSIDRDLNGYPDEDEHDPNDPTNGGIRGYGKDAIWRVAWWEDTPSGRIPVVAASFWLTEAWGDRLQIVHDGSAYVMGQSVESPPSNLSLPRILRTTAGTRVADYRSFFRLAIPTANDMPYYLASEWDRNGDGVVDPINTGSANPSVAGDGLGEIAGYPDVVPVGPAKETAAAIQDIFYRYRDEDTVRRIRQIPIASNITRVKYEYLHEVPVYMSQVNGGNVQIICQNVDTGEIVSVPAGSEMTSQMENTVPLISHWEQRVIDVAYNADYTDSTGAQYGGTYWRIADQYPEGYDVRKLDGTLSVNGSLPTTVGLGHLNGSNPAGWSCSAFYNVDSTGDDIADNAPIDRLAFVTTSVSGGQVVEGGVAQIRPDMAKLHGQQYYLTTSNPTGLGDMGDADGIPDGDGVPDDPVPGWWMPYLRAVRVTVVATPRQIIEERRSASGKEGKSGQMVYYRLDSPVPFEDANRTIPLYNLKKDYIGSGRDIVMTKTVPVSYVYRAELTTDPHSAALDQTSRRRVELNVDRASQIMFPDPLSPDVQIRSRTPWEKLAEKDPQP